MSLAEMRTGLGRKAVRGALSTVSRDGRMTEGQLRKAVDFFVTPVSEMEELAAWIQWNRDRGYVRSIFNEDWDRFEFQLSDLGRKKAEEDDE